MKNNTKQTLSRSLNKLIGLFKILVLLFVFLQSLHAQIQAPELYCIKNDTLFWNIPSNSCGPFISYQIYVSKNINGPYTLLADITNPTQNQYFDSNVNGMTLYYYMLSNYNCPGQVQIPSDTLDNLIPPLIPIESVTVLNGKTVITWLDNNSEQLAYIVYKNTPAGTVAIDTVFNGNSYTDLSSDPQNRSEIYYILSMDLCGNTSIFDKAHYSLFLTNPIDSCNSVIKLKWTPYQNWPNGVEEYQILVSVNGGPITQVGSVNGSTTNYQLTDLVSDDTLCITIKAVQANSSVSSVSNEICIVVNTIWVSLYNSSVDTNNQSNLAWKWSTNLLFKDAEIFAGNSISNIKTKLPFTSPGILPDSVLYLDGTFNPAQNPIFYQIRITDFCNNYTYSNILSTIFLKASAGSGFTNKLNWEFPAHENITISGYQIHRIINNQDVLLNSVSSGDLTLMDPVDINNPQEEYICYYVIAEGTAEILPGQFQDVNIKSNVACVGQSGSLFFPNAIVPDGLNNEFKPVGVFTDNGDYSLQIFDRWGKKVFETKDISEGWKGYTNDVALPIGLYAYVAELKQLNGNVIRQKGTVMLVR